MIFRCVKANDSSDVIAIGPDTNQGGMDYNGIGVWQNFTFDVNTLPQPSRAIMDIFNVRPQPLFKVVNGSMVIKTEGELI